MILSSIRNLLFFIKDILASRVMLWSMMKNDFKQQYLGSHFGALWAFMQPTVSILVFWFIFQVGFKSKPVDNYPFILWLISGIIPWFFFSDAWTKTTNSVIEYSFLVKKIVFNIKLLPIIKIGSSTYIHLFFIVFAVGIFSIYGYYPDIYVLQVFYYFIALLFLLLGLSWLSSAVQVFFKDFSQFIGIILQLGFWGTPIFWSEGMMPEKIRWLLKLNPLYYIIEGYRDSLINKVWFWEHPSLTLYFWSVSLLIFVIGALTFKQLKPHFSDVL
jgi:ABC-type polysaccharide/polyol phosphate export permease